MPHLARLNLADNEVEEDGAAALARAPWLGQLAEFKIADNGIDADDLQAILDRLNASTLTDLAVSANWLCDVGAARIGSCDRLGGLRRLEIENARITSAGLKALCDSPHLARLRYLYLSGNPLGSDAAQILAESSWQLTNLWLRDCVIDGPTESSSATDSATHSKSNRCCTERQRERDMSCSDYSVPSRVG
jgi:hypothetical protein